MFPWSSIVELGYHDACHLLNVQKTLDSLLLVNVDLQLGCPDLCDGADHKHRRPRHRPAAHYSAFQCGMGTYGHRTVSCTVLTTPHVVYWGENPSLRLGHDYLQRFGYSRHRHHFQRGAAVYRQGCSALQVRLYSISPQVGNNTGWDVANIPVSHSIFERVNIAGFFVQETILSGLYLWKSRALLGQYNKPDRDNMNESSHRRTSFSISILRSILSQLMIVNIIVLCIDSTIVVLEVSSTHN